MDSLGETQLQRFDASLGKAMARGLTILLFADSQYYAASSTGQGYSTYESTSYAQTSDAVIVNQDRAPRGQAPSSYGTEQARTPKRSPSLLRRINAALNSKQSSSATLSRVHSSGNKPQSDPMYAAPPVSGVSRNPGSSINPISRFRRARNADKSVRRREEEAGMERRPVPGEWREDARAGPSDQVSPRRRPEVREYHSTNSKQEIHRGAGPSPRHARTESDGYYWEEARRSSAVRARATEPLPRSSVVGRKPLQTQVSPSIGALEQGRERRYIPTGTYPSEGSGQRPYPRASGSGSPTSGPQRLGRYGIYAVPPAVTTQSGTKQAPNGSADLTERREYASPTRRMKGSEVLVSPPPAVSVNNSGGSTSVLSSTTRRRLPARRPSSTSASLTLVSEHPLVDRPLHLPPESLDREKAEEFAMDLTKRMSVLLNMDEMDVDANTYSTPKPQSNTIGSASTEEIVVESPGSTSGTATPTGSTTVAGASPTTGEESGPSSAACTEPISPFGTLLANAREMNDAFVRGTGSIWDKIFSKDKGKGKDEGPVDTDTILSPSTEDDHKDSNADIEEDGIEGSNDIMLYSPLIPSADSVVELASSEVVTLYGDGSDEGRERAYRAELRRRWADGRGFISFDALSTIEPVAEEPGESDYSQAQAEREPVAVLPESSKPAGGEPSVEQSEKAKPREKVIWVPSPTQISVQVLWWGYRIYLPPPVLHVLNSRTIETAKRAALLTSAFTWLLQNLPLASLPAPLAPAALLLKALVPLLGMIGTFISWSWKATVSFDRGNGVVLSATWLLPIVLIPGTWEDGDVSPPPPGIGVESSVAGPSRVHDT